MSDKILRGCLLLLTIAFLLLGVICKGRTDKYQGISVSTGVMIDGQYSEITSGKMGENSKKYEAYSTSGTMFFIFAGVTWAIWVIWSILDVKWNKLK